MEHTINCERLAIGSALVRGEHRGFTVLSWEWDWIKNPSFPFGVACNCRDRQLSGLLEGEPDRILQIRTINYLLDIRKNSNSLEGSTITVGQVEVRGMDNRTRRELEKSSANVIRVDFRNRRRAD
jgi:hypothetical protein